jgi:hypothetical protein
MYNKAELLQNFAYPFHKSKLASLSSESMQQFAYLKKSIKLTKYRILSKTNRASKKLPNFLYNSHALIFIFSPFFTQKEIYMIDWKSN